MITVHPDHRWRFHNGLPLFGCRFLSSLKTAFIVKNEVSGAVDDRGGHARVSVVVAAPGVRRDAGGWGVGFRSSGTGGQSGASRLVPKNRVQG
jgi:hypothetical protein